MNTAAQQLGRLGAGKKKTLTKEAIKQRRKAAKISGQKRKGKKIGPRKKSEINPPDQIAGAQVRRIEKFEDIATVPVEVTVTETVTEAHDAPAGDESVSDFEARKHLLS